MNSLPKIALSCALLISAAEVSATTNNQLYVAIEAGVSQTQFQSQYLDQTDLIAQNISTPVSQNGYTGGLALGYLHFMEPNYFIGAELSANVDGHSALYQSGSANTAFSDKIEMRHHVDLTIVPGIVTSSAFSPYVKAGIAYASVHDRLDSPVGYNPVTTQYSTNKSLYGFVGALGVKYMINQIGLFAEANYHDYGTTHFSSFQNFSADYTHSAHLYSYSVLLGALYAFNL